MNARQYLAVIALIVAQSVSAAPTDVEPFLNYNDGSGQAWTGWTYHVDINGSNIPGWRLTSTPILGAGETYAWGYGPRTANKNDYGASDSAIIDNTIRAPSDIATGGSFKVAEPDGRVDDSDNFSNWWVWYDGKPLSDRGLTTANTDRMSLYLKLKGMDPIGTTGGQNSIVTNFHFGTYLCWYQDGSVFGGGDGCPYESEGGQHYYHYMTANSGAWLHVLLDQHPTHKRGASGAISIPNNPAFAAYGKNYFEQMNQFYFEISRDQSQATAYWLDQVELYNESEPENEESVTTLYVGYWETGDYFEIGFQDLSFAALGEDSVSTFEIRWSTSPITNANYASATPVTPLYYGGASYTGNDNYIRRPNPYSKQAWTQFTLPLAATSQPQLYFAVKDVSVLGGNIGSFFPYNKGDGHDAPNSLVKTIDYAMPGSIGAPTTVAYTVPNVGWTLVYDSGEVLCTRGKACTLAKDAVYGQVVVSWSGIIRTWLSCIDSGCTSFGSRYAANAALTP